MKIKYGRSDVNYTIFVPWDCHKNCSYCVTKKLYAENKDFNIHDASCKDKYIDKIVNVSKGIPTKDFNLIFTGGEPLIFPDLLARLRTRLSEIGQWENYMLNTYMPPSFLKNCSENWFKGNGFTGFTISVEQDSLPSHEYLKENFSLLKSLGDGVSPRISMVVLDSSKESVSKALDWLLPFTKIGYQIILRADFSKIDKENVHNVFGDNTFEALFEISERYLGFSGCLICRTDRFVYNGVEIHYHRGSSETSYKMGDSLVINDMTLKPDLVLRYDWD